MKENRESRKQQLREEGDAEPILSSLPKDHYSRMKQVEAMFPEMVKEVKESNRQSVRRFKARFFGTDVANRIRRNLTERRVRLSSRRNRN